MAVEGNGAPAGATPARPPQRRGGGGGGAPPASPLQRRADDRAGRARRVGRQALRHPRAKTPQYLSTPARADRADNGAGTSLQGQACALFLLKSKSCTLTDVSCTFLVQTPLHKVAPLTTCGPEPERKRSMTPAKPNLTRRRFSQDLLAASSVAFPGWLHAQGKGKEIVVGGAGSHKIFLDPLIPVFEKQTGCKVLFEGTRSLVNLEKMLSNKSSPYMFVVLMDDPVMIAAVKEGVLDKLSAGAIPSLAKLKPGTVHMDGMWANYMQSTTGVAINPGKLRQRPSYATLWEPAFKNKLIIPSLQNTEGLAMIAAAAMLETGKPMKEAQYLPD